MTEQEKREQAIEELAQFMGECEIEGKSCAECKGSPDVQCGAWNEAVRLYNRIEEARKETAKEIYKALLGTEHIKELEQKEHCEWWVSVWRLEDLNRVFKEFGVEVEE